MVDISRRTLMQVTGAVGVTLLPVANGADDVSATERSEHQPGHQPAVPTAASSARTPVPPSPPHTTYLFFNSAEAAFIEAAVARLIPKDAEWGGAIEAAVPNYIDKQLAGAWGAGERLYGSGPWQPGSTSQGYQLPFTPAELFRAGISAINNELAQTSFAQLSAGQQDDYLKSLEGGGKDLNGVPSEVFFAHLWQSTIEGFFSDPVYGGNREMVSWRMIGFPGAYASYYDLVDQHGIKIDRPPMSLAEDVHGHIHMNPGIPARSP
jgi:gluconate 2-dehydrogenase gamma chain